MRFDEQLCGLFDFARDVDGQKVSAYLDASGLKKDFPLDEALINLDVAHRDAGELKMTNTGVLFFARTPEHFLKSAPVVCALYQGDEKSRILDRKPNSILTNLIFRSQCLPTR